MKLCRCDCVSCRSSAYESMNGTMLPTAGDKDSTKPIRVYAPINWGLVIALQTSIKITTWVTGPLALVANGLSLITFVRMYRAKQQVTTMWANAQCDGRPAEYRLRPLFNAAKFD